MSCMDSSTLVFTPDTELLWAGEGVITTPLDVAVLGGPPIVVVLDGPPMVVLPVRDDTAAGGGTESEGDVVADEDR